MTLVSSRDGAAGNTTTAPWPIHIVNMVQPSVVPQGAVDIDDLLAEFEATSKGAKAIAKGRQWVAKTFYADGASLAALRLQHGWSQAELARQSGTSQSYIGRLETGGIDPKLSTVRKIAMVLGVPVTALVDALTSEVQA